MEYEIEAEYMHEFLINSQKDLPTNLLLHQAEMPAYCIT